MGVRGGGGILTSCFNFIFGSYALSFLIGLRFYCKQSTLIYRSMYMPFFRNDMRHISLHLRNKFINHALQFYCSALKFHLITLEKMTFPFGPMWGSYYILSLFWLIVGSDNCVSSSKIRENNNVLCLTMSFFSLMFFLSSVFRQSNGFSNCPRGLHYNYSRNMNWPGKSHW